MLTRTEARAIARDAAAAIEIALTGGLPLPTGGPFPAAVRRIAGVAARVYRDPAPGSSGPLATRWPVKGRAPAATRVTKATDDTRALYAPHRYPRAASKYALEVSAARLKYARTCPAVAGEPASHPEAEMLAARVDWMLDVFAPVRHVVLARR